MRRESRTSHPHFEIVEAEGLLEKLISYADLNFPVRNGIDSDGRKVCAS